MASRSISLLLRTQTVPMARQNSFPAFPRHVSRTLSNRSIVAFGLRGMSTETPAPEAKDDSTASAQEKAKTGTPPVADSKEDSVAKLKEERDDLVNRLRYAQADLINAQRIGNVEKEKMRDFAITRFASDLVGTVDTLALALSSSMSSPPASSDTAPTNVTEHMQALRTGVELTHKQLLSTLEKYGISQFNPEGEKFDPNWHEALFEVPIEGKEPGTIVQTFKVGYKIKDRCLRAAQVGVARTAS